MLIDQLPLILTLAITLTAAVLLISERLRPDLIALLVLVSLGLSRLVSPAEAFAGFSGTAVMTILAISMISEGLHKTGVTHWLGRQMRRAGGGSEGRLIMVTLLMSAALSLLMNNIAAVGVLLPAVMTLSRQSKVPPSRLLMPLAFGTLLGGMATLLTTSNIIVSSALREAGFTPFGLLDFFPIGAPLVLVGAVYMALIGRRLLPYRQPVTDLAQAHRVQSELVSLYGIEQNLCHILVLPGSAVAGQSIQKGEWYPRFDLSVIGLIRQERVHMAPGRNEEIHEGDIVLAQGVPDVEKLRGYGLRWLQNPSPASKFTDERIVLAEVVLAPHTELVGKNLRELNFRERYGFNVLAVWREGKPLQSRLAERSLHFGDALLVQGPASRLKLLRTEPEFIVLEEDTDPVLKPNKNRLALLITLVTLGVAAFGWLPVAEVAFAGAVLMLLTGCLEMDDAYRSISWKAIFVIAGMWPLSIAIRSSGLADQAVHLLFQVIGAPPPLVLAFILLIISLILTQVMSGQVASLVLAPLALSAGQLLGVDPRSMGMAVALGCSLGFITPFGHPVNIMVMSAGGYTFRDFVKIGAPLTLLLIVTILFGLHLFWGL